jgi:hypothetical protein
MRKTNDSVVFESRIELGAIIHALEDWNKMHPGSEDSAIVKEFISLLDAIEMNW